VRRKSALALPFQRLTVGSKCRGEDSVLESRVSLGLFSVSFLARVKRDMQTLSIELPDSVFSALRRSPPEFVREMRLAAAVKWYETGSISQDKAAEIAGLTRSSFLDALARFRVSPFQYTKEELAAELSDAD